MLFVYILLALLLQLHPILCTRYRTLRVEAESSFSTNKGKIKSMIAASNEQILEMSNPDILQYELCVDTPLPINIHNIKYSIRGNPVILRVFIDDRVTWSLNMSTKFDINAFIDSGSLGDPILLGNGRYILSLEVIMHQSSLLKLDYFVLRSDMNFILSNIICLSEDRTVTIEMETFGSPSGQSLTKMPRSNASGQTSVYLHEAESIKYDFCIGPNNGIMIRNIIYSNDGDSDVIFVRIDNQAIGSFETYAISNGGHEWNNFRRSSAIGNMFKLSPGVHTIEIVVTDADVYGIELDYIEFAVRSVSDYPNSFSCKSVVKIEAETFDGGQLTNNLEASGDLALLLTTGDTLLRNICFRNDITLNFDKIAYLDNHSADLSLGITPGQFDEGKTSNNYPASEVLLSKGQYNISIKVTNAKAEGVQMDFLLFNINFGNHLFTSIDCLQIQLVVMEAEHFPSGASQGITYRSNASGHKNVYLKEGDTIQRSICVNGRVKLLMRTLSVSNDGGEDRITIKVQSVEVASVSTIAHSQHGEYWNIIEDKNLNNALFLNKGRYILEIGAIDTDTYGVEIDALTVEITGVNNNDFSLC